MKKKISVWIIACLALSSCVFAGPQNLKVAMVLWRGETKAEFGLKDKLKELGYSVHYTIYNAEQNRSNLAHMLRMGLEPKHKQFDYIYSFGTTASQMTRRVVLDRIPHIFNIVTAPKEAGIVENMDSTGGNVSGISHSSSLELQIKSALQIKKFTKIGYFFNPREENSKITLEQLDSIGKNYKFEVVIFRCAPNSEMLLNYLQKLVETPSTVDAVYLPLDSYIISKASVLGEKLKIAKIMSIGAQKDYIDNGALLGLIPDYYQLGTVAAGIIDRHRKGEKLENIPVHTVRKPTLFINETTRKALGISISIELLKKATIIR